MPSFFCRKYTGATPKAPLEDQSLILKDFTATVTTFSIDIGDFVAQDQTLTTSDSYALVGAVDIHTIYFKNTAPGSVGYLIVTGVLEENGNN